MIERIDPHARGIFLRRLERLLRLRRYGQDGRGGDLNDVGRHLLDLCIDATIDDCAWQGAAGAAADLLAEHRRLSR